MSMAGALARGLRAILGDRSSTRAIDYDGAGGGRRLRHAGEMPLPLAAQINRADAARAPGAVLGRSRTATLQPASQLGNRRWSGAGSSRRARIPSPKSAPRSTRHSTNGRATPTRMGCSISMASSPSSRGASSPMAKCFSIFTHADGELRLRLMDGEQVNGAYHTELAYGSRVVAGIEFDQNGKRTAIHAWKQRPGCRSRSRSN